MRILKKYCNSKKLNFILIFAFSLFLLLLLPWNKIVHTLSLNYQLIFTHYLTTLFETFGAIILSIILTIVIFMISIKLPFIRDLSLKLLLLFQTIPLIVLAPTLLTIFGFSISLRVIIVAFLGIYPILINLDSAYSHIKGDEYILFDLIKANFWFRFKHLIFPSIVLSFFAGLKLTTSYAFASVILIEYIGGTYGLGIYLARATQNFDRGAISIIVILSVITTFLLLFLINLIERKYLAKYYGGLL